MSDTLADGRPLEEPLTADELARNVRMEQLMGRLNRIELARSTSRALMIDTFDSLDFSTLEESTLRIHQQIQRDSIDALGFALRRVRLADGRPAEEDLSTWWLCWAHHVEVRYLVSGVLSPEEVRRSRFPGYDEQYNQRPVPR